MSCLAGTATIRLTLAGKQNKTICFLSLNYKETKNSLDLEEKVDVILTFPSWEQIRLFFQTTTSGTSYLS